VRTGSLKIKIVPSSLRGEGKDEGDLRKIHHPPPSPLGTLADMPYKREWVVKKGRKIRKKVGKGRFYTNSFFF